MGQFHCYPTLLQFPGKDTNTVHTQLTCREANSSTLTHAEQTHIQTVVLLVEMGIHGSFYEKKLQTLTRDEKEEEHYTFSRRLSTPMIDEGCHANTIKTFEIPTLAPNNKQYRLLPILHSILSPLLKTQLASRTASLYNKLSASPAFSTHRASESLSAKKPPRWSLPDRLGGTCGP